MSKRFDGRVEAKDALTVIVDYLTSMDPLAVRGRIEEAVRLGTSQPPIPRASESPYGSGPTPAASMESTGPERWVDEAEYGVLGVSLARPDPVWAGMSHTMH